MQMVVKIQRSNKKTVFNVGIICLWALFLPAIVFASEKEGKISQSNKYAWGEKIGWVNFNPTNGNVRVADDGLSGYAWSANYGWINLAPENAGVKNNGEGELSGKAWNDKLGWIDFSGITVDEEGRFSGVAGSEQTVFGRMSFECDGCGVQTDWRPESVREDSDDDDGSNGGHVSGNKVKDSAGYADVSAVAGMPAEIFADGSGGVSQPQAEINSNYRQNFPKKTVVNFIKINYKKLFWLGICLVALIIFLILIWNRRKKK
jgi:hypothetical protein